MDFNEYWKIGCFGEYHDIYAKNLAEQFYNAGQESKQEEVNKLQEEINALKDKINIALKALEKLDDYDYNEDLDSVFLILGAE